MHPIISIVGSKNVGKSRLFELLTGQHQSGKKRLVPTRDRKYGVWKTDDFECILVDTGGISKEKDELNKLIINQVKVAMQESSMVVFLVDAKLGLTYLDIEIGKLIRKENKPILLLINYATYDNISNLGQFKSLGITDICEIENIDQRSVMPLQTTLQPLIKKIGGISPQTDTEEQGIKVAVLGRPNAGKSTLINTIIGENRVIISDIPGTTLDSIKIPFQDKQGNFIFIDTAGIRRKVKIKSDVEENIIYRSLRSIDLADVVIYIVSADQRVVDQDLKLIRYIIKVGKPMILAANKRDLVHRDNQKDVLENIKHRIRHLKYVKLEYISAKNNIKLASLMRSVKEVYLDSMKDISTSQLTNILGKAVEDQPPPLVKGKSAKLRYAHLGGKNPHLIIIHGARSNQITKTYERYLKNCFYDELNFYGIQIKFIFKDKK